jgi:adenylate kinase family enzyme
MGATQAAPINPGAAKTEPPLRQVRLAALCRPEHRQTPCDDERMPSEARTGSLHTKLIVIRGNSGSGKSSIARQLQLRHGRGCALVEQDYLRRIVLRERDKPGGVASALIEHTVRFALDHDYHVILEGILHTGKYADMIASLWRAHTGQTFFYYLDVSLDETLRRHQTRPQASQFTADDMRAWYNPHDVLGFGHEHVLPETTSVDEAIMFIAASAGLPEQSCHALPT